MQVVKRDGTTEEFDFSKIEKIITFACPDEDDRKEFMKDLKLNLKNGMTTKEIHRTVTQLAVEKIGPHTTRWDAVASKLYLYNLVKEAGLNRGVTGFKYGNYYELVKTLTEKKLYSNAILDNYSKEELDEMGEYIKPERDFLFTYAGARLMERYIVRGYKKEIYELWQEAYMGIALTLALAEKKENRIKYAKDFYDVLSNHELTTATPTFANARRPNSQYSSCFESVWEDSMESIMNVADIFATVSKNGGGFGLYASKIRASGSAILGHAGASSGPIPFIQIMNSVALAANQLGTRNAGIAIYLDVHHLNIFDFLQLKTNAGDTRLKAHDIFTGICIPDLFMKQVKSNSKWYLFCPYEIKKAFGKSLEDTWGEEYENFYWECVNNKDLRREEINARDLMKEIIKSCSETGVPYLFFRDTANRMNPNSHAGMVYCSNLCSEIIQNQSPNGEVKLTIEEDEKGELFIRQEREAGDFVVCNLSSLNLGKVNKEEDIKRVVPIAIRMMDNVITLNKYPVKEAEITNKKYRAVGLGTSNLHYALMSAEEEPIAWESNEHVQFVDKLYENINFYAIKASMELAKEKGAYSIFENSEWHTGEYFEKRNYNSERWLQLKEEVKTNKLRNAYVLAIAPTASTSTLVGGTAGIDPTYSKFFIEQKKGIATPMFPPRLDEFFWFYKEAHTINQTWSVKANNARARHVDQSISFNLYIDTNTTAADIMKLYFLAWSGGTKTIYYTRARSNEIEEDCISCSA